MTRHRDVDPGPGKRQVRILYLFAGSSRKGDVKSRCIKLCKMEGAVLVMEEVDVLPTMLGAMQFQPIPRQKVMNGDIT